MQHYLIALHVNTASVTRTILLRMLEKLVQLIGKTLKKTLVDEFEILRQKFSGQTCASSEIRTVSF